MPISDKGTAFANSTKARVEELDNGSICWNCGASPTDVCHVIPKTDRDFELYRRRGMLSIGSVSDVNNGIPLCPTCHRNFDDLFNPGFVFIPTDLEYFREYEEADKIRRAGHFLEKRTFLQRTCPSAEDYRQYQRRQDLIGSDEKGGLYEKHTLRDYFPKRGCFRNTETARTGILFPPLAWHGDPMAALRRGFAILGNIAVDLPIAKKKALHSLLSLYEENDYDLKTLALLTDSANDQDEDSVSEPHSRRTSAGSSLDRSSVKDIREEPPSSRAIETTSAPLEPLDLSHKSPPPYPCADNAKEAPVNQKYRSVGYELWKWGPKSTSNEICDFYTKLRNITQNRIEKVG
ncbi:hypothetical protein N8T08_004686 [Aspergillus melleus]|uniref:Uncharacterized protein n=1 Tax=Aspergillus melleus TaxID=138277 RepID=A0ACC3B3H0_9EURO|nr:hypothetical protein N8T08_004686 [Aspergillus melleus]